MSVADRSKHTVSQCAACYVNHCEFQELYPLQPVYKPDLNLKQRFDLSKSGRAAASSVLKELNGMFKVNFNQTYLELSPSIQVADNNRTGASSSKRQIKLDVKKAVETGIGENMAIAHLAECESDASYSRKRKIAGFEWAPPGKTSKFVLIPAEKEGEILSFLSNCETPVIWSAVAKRFDIGGTNADHAVKQLAISKGLNVENLQGKKEKANPVSRVHKKKIGDHYVSIPCLPTLEKS